MYDANGNLLAMTDTNDVTSRYEYDVMNRLIKVAEPDKVFVINGGIGKYFELFPQHICIATLKLKNYLGLK